MLTTEAKIFGPFRSKVGSDEMTNQNRPKHKVVKKNKKKQTNKQTKKKKILRVTPNWT